MSMEGYPQGNIFASRNDVYSQHSGRTGDQNSIAYHGLVSYETKICAHGFWQECRFDIVTFLTRV